MTTFAWWSVSKAAPKKGIKKGFVGEIKLLNICLKLNFTCKLAEKNEMGGRKPWM